MHDGGMNGQVNEANGGWNEQQEESIVNETEMSNRLKEDNMMSHQTNMGIKKGLLFLMMFALALFAAACGNAEDEQGLEAGLPDNSSSKQEQPSETGGASTSEEKPNIEDRFSNEPVTVTLYSHYAAINTENDVQALFGPVMEKYPNISIELIKGRTLYDMLSAGEIPDLVATQHYHMATLLPLEVGIDMTSFVKEYDIDLDRFHPQVIDAIRTYSETGELLSIPYTLNYGVLLYNKDIFDRFGVEYPADGMTWQETIELAKRVTRLDEGVQYIGLNPGSERTIVRGYSAPTVSEDGKEALLTTEPYQKVLSLMKEIYSIPGMIREDGSYSLGWNEMLQEQRLAMFPTWLAAITSRLITIEQEGGGLNWDIASHPVFEDTPEYGREVEFQSLMVPPTAKNKDAAFQIIWAMTTDEIQEKMNRGNNLTILDRPDLRSEFAADTQLYKDKNLEGIFTVSPAPTPRPSRHDAEMYSFLRQAFKAVILEGVDVNSALRAANEEANNYLKTVD